MYKKSKTVTDTDYHTEERTMLHAPQSAGHFPPALTGTCSNSTHTLVTPISVD